MVQTVLGLNRQAATDLLLPRPSARLQDRAAAALIPRPAFKAHSDLTCPKLALASGGGTASLLTEGGSRWGTSSPKSSSKEPGCMALSHGRSKQAGGEGGRQQGWGERPSHKILAGKQGEDILHGKSLY